MTEFGLIVLVFIAGYIGITTVLEIQSGKATRSYLFGLRHEQAYRAEDPYEFWLLIGLKLFSLAVCIGGITWLIIH